MGSKGPIILFFLKGLCPPNLSNKKREKPPTGVQHLTPLGPLSNPMGQGPIILLQSLGQGLKGGEEEGSQKKNSPLTSFLHPNPCATPPNLPPYLPSPSSLAPPHPLTCAPSSKGLCPLLYSPCLLGALTVCRTSYQVKTFWGLKAPT